MSKSAIYICLIFGLLVFGVLGFSDANENKDELNEIVKIALRDVGNSLLLAQNDSSSLIKPIISLGRLKYQLSFEKELGLEPSDIVATIEQSFQKAKLPSNYRVEVKQCRDKEVAYSFEINASNEATTIIPCAGRLLPEACYLIELRFLNAKTSFFDSRNALYVLAFVIFMLIMFVLLKRKSVLIPKEHTKAHAAIGSFRFYPDQNKLVKKEVEISLSRKECQILEIFVANLNQVVKRDELTKKVWEDNGVFVGRSLDTYISKLRKKLIEDESIKLTNVHGVGYKLSILG